MKKLSFYTFETKRVSILWNGITQPFGNFYSATAAKEFIETKINSGTTGKLTDYCFAVAGSKTFNF